MFYKIIFIIIFKLCFFFSKYNSFFWKKSINLELYFFSQSFVNKIFFWKKNFHVFNKFFAKVLVTKKFKKSKYYKGRKALEIVSDKNSSFFFVKKISKTRTRRTIKNRTRTVSLRTLKKWKKQSKFKQVPYRKKFYIIKTGYRKGQRQYIYKPRKYYAAQLKYNPSLLSVNEISREIMKHMEFRSSREYWYMRNYTTWWVKRNRGETFRPFYDAAFHRQQRWLKNYKAYIARDERWREKEYLKEITRMFKTVFKNRYPHFNTNLIKSFYLLEKNLKNFKFKNTFDTFNFLSGEKRNRYKSNIRIYAKNLKKDWNFLGYKKFIKTFTQSFIFKKIIKKNSTLNHYNIKPANFVKKSVKLKKARILNFYRKKLPSNLGRLVFLLNRKKWRKFYYFKRLRRDKTNFRRYNKNRNSTFAYPLRYVNLNFDVNSRKVNYYWKYKNKFDYLFKQAERPKYRFKRYINKEYEKSSAIVRKRLYKRLDFLSFKIKKSYKKFLKSKFVLRYENFGINKIKRRHKYLKKKARSRYQLKKIAAIKFKKKSKFANKLLKITRPKKTALLKRSVRASIILDKPKRLFLPKKPKFFKKKFKFKGNSRLKKSLFKKSKGAIYIKKRRKRLRFFKKKRKFSIYYQGKRFVNRLFSKNMYVISFRKKWKPIFKLFNLFNWKKSRLLFYYTKQKFRPKNKMFLKKFKKLRLKRRKFRSRSDVKFKIFHSRYSDYSTKKFLLKKHLNTKKINTIKEHTKKFFLSKRTKYYIKKLKAKHFVSIIKKLTLRDRLRQSSIVFQSKSFYKNKRFNNNLLFRSKVFFENAYLKSFNNVSSKGFNWQLKNNFYKKFFMFDKKFDVIKFGKKSNSVKIINFFLKNKSNKKIVSFFKDTKNKKRLLKKYFKKVFLLNLNRKRNVFLSNKLSSLQIAGITNFFKFKYSNYVNKKFGLRFDDFNSLSTVSELPVVKQSLVSRYNLLRRKYKYLNLKSRLVTKKRKFFKRKWSRKYIKPLFKERSRLKKIFSKTRRKIFLSIPRVHKKINIFRPEGIPNYLMYNFHYLDSSKVFYYWKKKNRNFLSRSLQKLSIKKKKYSRFPYVLTKKKFYYNKNNFFKKFVKEKVTAYSAKLPSFKFSKSMKNFRLFYQTNLLNYVKNFSFFGENFTSYAKKAHLEFTIPTVSDLNINYGPKKYKYTKERMLKYYIFKLQARRFRYKLYMNSSLKRFTHYRWKTKKGIVPFVTPNTSGIHWIFKNRRLHNFFFKIYSAKKIRGFYRNTFMHLYRKNSRTANKRLNDFSNKNLFFHTTKKMFVPNRIFLNDPGSSKFKNNFCSKKDRFLISSKNKKIYIKKNLHDTNLFGKELLKIKNKNLFRFLNYKNSIFYSILRKKISLNFRKKAFRTPYAADQDFNNKMDSIIDDKREYINNFKLYLWSSNFRLQATNGRVTKKLIKKYRSNSFIKKFILSKNFFSKFATYDSKKRSILFKYSKKSRNIRRFLKNEYTLCKFINRYKFYVERISKSKPKKNFSFKKIKRRKKFRLSKNGIDYKFIKRKKPKLIKTKINSKFYKKNNRKFLRNRVNFKFYKKNNRKFLRNRVNFKFYKKNNRKFMRNKVNFKFYKKNNRKFNVKKTNRRFYKKNNFRFNKKFVKYRFNKIKSYKLRKNFINYRRNKGSINSKFNKRIKPNFFKLVLKHKFIRYKSVFLQKKDNFLLYHNNIYLKKNLFFHKNFEKLVKKNLLYNQVLSLKANCALWITSVDVNYYRATKNYINLILNRLSFKPTASSFNVVNLKKFVLKLFIFLQKNKQFFLNFKKKFINDKRRKFKKNIYCKVILKRTKWIYFIGLFDINNRMLIHFDYLSLGIRFSKKTRINFYKTWHKMMFKFFVEMMKNGIFAINEVVYFKKTSRKNRIKLSWVYMFFRQHLKAFETEIESGIPTRLNKISFSNETTKKKKRKR